MEPWTEPTEGRSGAGPGGPAPAEGARQEAGPPSERSRFDFERGWMAAACLLLFAAAALLYLGHPEAAFVTAALGVSAWFLSVRAGLKRKHDLVKRGGRNWEPRGRVEASDVEEPEDEGSED